MGPYANFQPVNPAKKRRDVLKRDFDLVSAGPEWHTLNAQYLVERNFYKVTAGNVDTWVANKVKNKDTVQLIFEDAAGKSTCNPY